ncbi:MAG: hypothetical protein D6698_15140 [Gammaproteobacteria bacterium]|nr:MAG: hypothetical protein D6698_15140 [Gammaproteobacteria bacterium]
MLVRPGVLHARRKAATSGFVSEKFSVRSRTSADYNVPVGAVNHTGRFAATMRWAENRTDQHFLLTPQYMPLSMEVRSRAATFVLSEPIEVPTYAGWHIYPRHVALNHSGKQYQVVR